MKLAKRESKNENALHLWNTGKETLEWVQIKSPSTLVSRRCCHASCMIGNRLFIYGGYDNNTHGILKDMFTFTIGSNSWEALKQNGELPGSRHSQTMVVYQDKIYMFGGMYDIMNNTNALHVYDVETAKWNIKKTQATPQAIDSHRACLWGEEMIVCLGYSQGEQNSNIYALNLNTFVWRILFRHKDHKQTKYPKPRAQGSVNLYKDTLVIYGGKNFNVVYEDIWLFDIKQCQFSKLQLQTKIQGRFGHAGVVYDDKLYVFGGTKGVTHERNDLIMIDFVKGSAKTCWTDSQQQRSKFHEDTGSNMKKSRRDSLKKIGIDSANDDENESSYAHKSPCKYRNQLKEVNYYNSLYDNQRRELNNSKKARRNPLLTQLDLSHQNQSLNLTSTFEILTNSIMLMMGGSHSKEEKSEPCSQGSKKIPKARDNYSADLYVGDQHQMIIFGGSMHKISYNDVILIDLKAINARYISHRQ